MNTRVGPMVLTLAGAMGMTTSQMATQLGMHRNRLSEKIHGRQHFTEAEIVALAELFGVSVCRMFEDPRALLGVGSTD